MTATSCIYKITNTIDNKVYIGKTTDIDRRWKAHVREYEKYNNRYLYRAMNKHGIANFHLEVLETNIPNEMIDEYEIRYIKLYNSKSPNGYNMTDGGEGSIGRPMNEKTKKILLDYRLNNSPSKQTRDKMSKSHKNRYKNPEERKKLSESMKGHKKSSNQGYINMWTNKSQEEKKIQLDILRSHRIVSVQMLDLQTLIVIKEFDSVRGASKWIRENTNYPKAGHSNISKACKGLINHVYGYKWSYK